MAPKNTKTTKNSEVRKKLVLLDAHAILHRAYHALPDFMSAKGEPTGALFGLVTMLLKIIEEIKPDYIVACYDLPQPTHRHDVYKEYKAGRKKSEPELVAQLQRSRDVFEAFNIPLYDKPGFEADDMLGTIVEQILSSKKEFSTIDVVIASGDMDTLQLISGDRVRVYTLKKGIKDTIIYNEKAVIDRFGFGPALLPDYKGLRGDTSDNIIGIKGIGEKTGASLISKFGTIENLYEALKKDKEQFLIDCKSVGVTPRIVELLVQGEEEAMFSKTLATIRRDAPITFVMPSEWKVALDIARVEALFNQLDFRTLGARVRKALGMEGKSGDQYGIQEGGLPYVEPQKENIDEALLRETLLALWVVDSNKTNPVLEDLMQFTGQHTFKEARDVIFKELEKRNGQRVFNDIEKPLIPVTDMMREWGIKVDVKYLAVLAKKYHTELDTIQKTIWQLAGEEFNIASPKQLGEILFVKLGLKPKNQKKTGTGALSTKESELEKLRGEHPIIEEIFKYREYSKLLSTYIDVIPTLVDKDQRLHSTLLQAGSTTGRMASENPNMQNIPNKTELGRAIRRAFIAEKGMKLVAFDYSQIELRIAAFLSGDEKLIEIFRKGEDVHTAVASQVFGVPLTEVTKDMRRKAKVINFGVMYGMGVNALRQNLGAGVTRDEAQIFYNEYFAKFSGLAAYLNQSKADAARNGYVETFFGRRRYFEGIHSKLPFIRAAAERMAINAPIQGTEADIVKLAMIKIAHFLKEKKMDADVRMLLQVHDELVFEIKETLIAKIVPEIRIIMESVIDPKETKGIIARTDAKQGDNWEEMEMIVQSN